MSQEIGPENTIPESADPPPAPPEEPPRAEPAKLQRQTFVMVNDRGRLVLLVALCTLAGVGVGFGLASLVAAQRTQCSHSRAYPPMVLGQVAPMAPSRPVAPRDRCGHGHGCDRSHGWVGRHGIHIWDGDEGVHIWDDDDGFHLWSDDGDDEGYLGIHIAAADPGVRVVGVAADSPAAAAGIQVDDVVIEFDGEKVDVPDQLVRLVRDASPGEEVSLKLERAGVARRVEAALASLEDRMRW